MIVSVYPTEEFRKFSALYMYIDDLSIHMCRREVMWIRVDTVERADGAALPVDLLLRELRWRDLGPLEKGPVGVE